MRPNQLHLRRHLAGFTLVELMIATVVVSILVAVALPSFLDSMRKGRRSEAFTALSAMQLAQERWRSNKSQYADNLSNGPTDTPPGLGIPATTTPGGYYTLSIVPAADPATGYTVTATAVANKSQANDGECAQLGVEINAGAILYAGNSSGALVYSATNPCWAK